MGQDTDVDDTEPAAGEGIDDAALAAGQEIDAQILREAVSAVYAATPAEFVEVRKAWVKRLRDEGLRDAAREVGALRKPSVAAGVINAVVAAQDPVTEQLRHVGARLRQAQSAMDSAALSGLRNDRDGLLHGWVSAARRHAQRPITAAVEAEVRDTAVAALADAGATDLVLGGTLTRALSTSGFGEVDVADAVARTSTGVLLVRLEGGGQGAGPSTLTGDPAADDGRERAARQRRRDALKEKAEAAQKALVAAERAAAAARSRVERAQAEATKAEAALRRARQDRDTAQTAADQA